MLLSFLSSRVVETDRCRNQHGRRRGVVLKKEMLKTRPSLERMLMFVIFQNRKSVYKIPAGEKQND